MTAPYDSARNKINRVTFNAAVKPLMGRFPGKDNEELYGIINSYLSSVAEKISERAPETSISKPVLFRAFMALLPIVAQRVKDKYSGRYTPENFGEFLGPVFANMPKGKLQAPGTSWSALRDYLERRFASKAAL